MAKKPRNFKEKLDRLRELSRSLNARMEDGTFYRQSYWARSREIREIKRLYNRLRGPLSEGALQSAVSFASVLALVTGLGCGYTGGDTASVSLQITVGTKGKSLARSAFTRDAAPSSIESISLTVTGSGMDEINETIPLDTGSISVKVPAGSNRTFRVRAETAYDAYLMGSAVVDLSPGSVNEVPVSMEVYGMPVLNTTGSNNPFGLPGESYSTYPAFVDIDGDGDQDLVINVGSGSIDSALIFYENQSGSFISMTTPSGTLPPAYYGYATFADMDGDGDYDLLSSYITDSDIKFFENTGSVGSASFATPSSIFVTGYFSIDTIGDIDNDGDLDIFAGRRAGAYVDDTIHFFENTGTAESFTFGSDQLNAFGIPDFISFSNALSPMLVDIDNDGDLDLLIGIRNEPFTITYLAENTGTAESPDFTSTLQEDPFGIDSDLNTQGFDRVFLAFADIDGDGDLDLFVGNNTGDIRYYENIIIP